MATQASLNRKLVELNKEVVYLNGVVWDLLKRLEFAGQLPPVPGPSLPPRRA